MTMTASNHTAISIVTVDDRTITDNVVEDHDQCTPPMQLTTRTTSVGTGRVSLIDYFGRFVMTYEARPVPRCTHCGANP